MAKFTLVKVPFILRILGSNLVRKYKEPTVAIQSYENLLTAVKKPYDDEIKRLSEEKKPIEIAFEKKIKPVKDALEKALKGEISDEDKKRLKAEYEKAIGPSKKTFEESVEPFLAHIKLNQEDMATVLKALEADKEELEAQFTYHNKCQSHRRKIYETRCRLQACTNEKRKNKMAVAGKKVRRGQQMFCGSHVHIRHQLTSEQYKELANNVSLRVAV